MKRTRSLVILTLSSIILVLGLCGLLLPLKLGAPKD